MTETRTTRFSLPQWSAGSDSPSRTDLNEAFNNLAMGAAYDTGVTASALPTTGLYAGQYHLVAVNGNNTLYRRNDASGWGYAGGNTNPYPSFLQPYLGAGAGGPALTAAALTVDHPDQAEPGAEVAYTGTARFGGTLRSYDLNSAAAGAVMIGTNAAADLATLGRLHVRTRTDGDKGLTLRAHGSGAGPIFAAQATGGADVLTIDSAGNLRQAGASGFGGAAIPTASSLAVAPTSASDSITNGLLLYGQDSQPTKSIMGVLRSLTDPDGSIFTLSRDNAQVGRLPWGSTTADGQVLLVGRQANVRAWGYTADNIHFQVRRADATTPTNPALDTVLYKVGPTGASTYSPSYLSNQLATAEPPSTLYRHGTTASLQYLATVTNPGNIITLVSEWHGDGRLRVGTPWRGAGTMRDARQAILHTSNKIWAAPGADPDAGIKIQPNTSYTYTWAVMTSRSQGTLDLDVQTSIEVMLGGLTAQYEDAQVVSVRTEININGAGWTVVKTTENVPMAVGNETAHRFAGNTFGMSHRALNLTGGQTFQLRTVVTAGVPLVDVYLRSLDLIAEECSIENYTAP